MAAAEGGPETDQQVVAEERDALIRTVAQQALGFDELRPGQLEAAGAVLEGRDVLAVMPTGSGKSGVYQVAGALVQGVVVVISPLLALQRDQVAQLDGRLGGARVLNSDLTDTEHEQVLQAAVDGDIRFVLMAPEQLLRDDTRRALATAEVGLMVVDEAHCIAGWGHDFRPAFLQLGECRRAIGSPQVLALTATASAPVRAEIIAELQMDEPAVITAGVVRPEIALSVVDVRDHSAAEERLIDLAHARPGTGLVYAATRAACEDLAERITTSDRPALAYHAGLAAGTRAEVEERFGQDAPVVVVATTAFGMGIDAPHVRFVIHRDVPASLDDYYQEFGRAGRDGADAEAILIRQLEQASARRMEGGTASVPPSLVARVARDVAAAGGDVAVEDLAEDADVTDTRLLLAIELLTRAGAVQGDVGLQTVRWIADDDVDPLVQEAITAHRRDATLGRTQGEMMRRYLDARDCRWRIIGAYFGEQPEAACGRCDRCDSGEVGEAESVDGPVVGAIVQHETFGRGEVQGADERTLTVLFDEAGYRTLGREMAEPHMVEAPDD